MAKPDLAPLVGLGVPRWGYLAPDPDAWRVIRSQQWIDALHDGLRKAGVRDPLPLVEGVRDAAASFKDLDEWAAESNRAFGPGAIASPCETDYTASSPFMQANDLADIRGFYAAFGVQPSVSQAERADHIALELEFLELLAWRHGQATTEEDREVTRDAACKFLETHLGRFVEKFAGKAEEAPMNPLFAGLAAVTRELVMAAVRGLDLHPAPLTILPQVEPDEMQCGACPAVAPKPS